MNRRKFLKAVMGGMVAAALPKLPAVPAMGGPIKAGAQYWVGERGCNLWLPSEKFSGGRVVHLGAIGTLPEIDFQAWAKYVDAAVPAGDVTVTVTQVYP